MNNYNKELILVYNHIIHEYEKYMRSNRIKNDDERKRWGHSIQTLRYIINNCNITDKTNPREYKKHNSEHTDIYDITTQ